MSFDPDRLPIPDLGLRCPRCGYVLAGLPQHRCPECWLNFEMEDLLPPGDYPVVIYDGREVAMTDEIAELLKAAQIPYMELRSNLDNVLGLTYLNTQGVKLGVPRASYFEVIHLLREYAAGHRLEPNPTGGAPWPCPRCGEENPPNFEVCWNCNGERPEE